jgi:thiamine biosynthesis protein ThiI
MIIVHYGELALKGKNRSQFEKLLRKNIEAKIPDAKTKMDMGHINVETTISNKKAIEILTKIPGIEYFSFAEQAELSIESINKVGLKVAKAFQKNNDVKTFKITTKRRYKDTELDTPTINNKVGFHIGDKLNVPARMKDPDLDLKVEIVKDAAYISTEDIRGVGGFPVNPEQKIVALLSGGFDSPVAAYQLIRRGCEVILVHFQNKNTLTKAVQDKVEKLAKQLSKFQTKTTLYIVHFEDIQKDIIKDVKADYRMLIYRGVMLRIAEGIAQKHKARFLITGDALSQVASQTINNLEAVYPSVDMRIFTPLIGFDKNDILKIAKKIGTYEISNLPYGDCCSYFVPEHPKLKARKEEVQHILDKVKVDVVKEIKESDVQIY